jgi:hypothetical protein
VLCGNLALQPFTVANLRPLDFRVRFARYSLSVRPLFQSPNYFAE